MVCFGTQYLNLLNTSESWAFLPGRICFDIYYIELPQRLELPQNQQFFNFFLWSKTDQSCLTFWVVTFDSVELQKWSCTLEKPQTICQKLVMYLYGARMAHCSVWDYFLISGHQNFCRIRYCGRVWYVRVLIKNTNFATNEGIIGQIKTRCVRKGMWPLIAKHNTSRTNWMNKIEDNLTMK